MTELLSIAGGIIGYALCASIVATVRFIRSNRDPLVRDWRPPEGNYSHLSPLEYAEMMVVAEYYRRNKYNKTRTRKELGITVNTLKAKLRKYGIKAPQEEANEGTN